MKRVTAIFVVGVLFVIAACSTNEGYLAPDTGLALRAGLAKQIVDPKAAEGPPMATTEKAAAAIARYRNDEIKDPSPEEMTFITAK